jgi:hypothetical protein
VGAEMRSLVCCIVTLAIPLVSRLALAVSFATITTITAVLKLSDPLKHNIITIPLKLELFVLVLIYD